MPTQEYLKDRKRLKDLSCPYHSTLRECAMEKHEKVYLVLLFAGQSRSLSKTRTDRWSILDHGLGAFLGFRPLNL